MPEKPAEKKKAAVSPAVAAPAAATPAAPAFAPTIDMGLTLQVGKYEIQTSLGKGATGTVYLAKDTFTGKIVALKTIEPEVFNDPEFGAVYRQQFQNEASLAGKIRHPHIVTVFDAMVGEDSGYIAMEVVSGGDLSQYAKAGALLPPADVLQIGFKCCGALDYAYRDQGIVHRDIKPANIMVTKDGDVKIADFGSAFLRKSKGTQTTAMGSPFYMAPEQIEGKELTFHSDMYSMGVVLYELLTGKRPFSANSIEALVQQILFEEPTPPSRLREGLRPEIDQVVLRAMKKRPDQRYGTWAQFSVELSKAVALVLPAGEIADSEKYLALSKVEMLQLLSDADFWELAAAGKWSRAPKATILIKEDTPGTSFFFLAKGEVKVTRGNRLLNTVGEGECFGEMAYIRGGEEPRHATVQAVSDVLIAEFVPETLEKMGHQAQLHLTRALVRNVVDRLVLANQRFAH